MISALWCEKKKKNNNLNYMRIKVPCQTIQDKDFYKRQPPVAAVTDDLPDQLHTKIQWTVTICLLSRN